MTSTETSSFDSTTARPGSSETVTFLTFLILSIALVTVETQLEQVIPEILYCNCFIYF